MNSQPLTSKINHIIKIFQPNERTVYFLKLIIYMHSDTKSQSINIGDNENIKMPTKVLKCDDGAFTKKTKMSAKVVYDMYSLFFMAG